MNQQRIRFRNCLIEPLDALIPELPGAEILEAFFHQNGFLSIRDRDQAGWSPICYAAMNGDPQLVEALLSNGADPNDCIFHPKSEALNYAGSTVLAIAAGFGSNGSCEAFVMCQSEAKPKGLGGDGGRGNHCMSQLSLIMLKVSGFCWKHVETQAFDVLIQMMF